MQGEEDKEGSKRGRPTKYGEETEMLRNRVPKSKVAELKGIIDGKLKGYEETWKQKNLKINERIEKNNKKSGK